MFVVDDIAHDTGRRYRLQLMKILGKNNQESSEVVDDIPVAHDTRKDIDRGKYESAVKVRDAPDLWRLRGVLDGVVCNHF